MGSRSLHDDERVALLIRSPSSNSQEHSRMSLADKLYAYDLTLATLTYQRWGQNPRGRLLWEALSHTGDGIMYVVVRALSNAKRRLNGCAGGLTAYMALCVLVCLCVCRWLLMVLPVLVLSWFAGLLDHMALSTKTITASFYICMFVRVTCIHWCCWICGSLALNFDS